MSNSKRKLEKLLAVTVFLLCLLMISNALYGSEAHKKIKEKSQTKANFILTTKDNLLSLRARDASLKEILEAIGRRMKIEMVGNIPEEERVTIRFDKLSLEDAIKSLSKNYVVVKESGKEKGKITKITILTEGKTREVAVREGSTPPEHEERPTRPEPFKFEFDPSEFEEGK